MKTGKNALWRLFLVALGLQLVLLALLLVDRQMQTVVGDGSLMLWLGAAVIARGHHPFNWHWWQIWGSWRK